MKRQSKLIAAFALLGSLIPKSAYAWDFFNIAGIGADFFSNFILMFFVGLNAILAKGLEWMSGLVSFAVNLHATTNLPVIYEIWTLLRNFCNMGFVVILTVIALSYILSVLPGAKRYATTSNIINLLVAALILNFSFAVGQAIVFAGNALTGITLKVLPNQDIGGSLVRGFQPVSTGAGNFALIGTYDPAVAAIEGLSITALKDVTAAENTRYHACLQEQTPEGQSAFVNAKVGGSLPPRDKAKDGTLCAHEILAARRGEQKMRVGQTSSALTPEENRARNNVLSAAPNPTVQFEISLILGEMLTVFINLALLLCFGSIILFLFIRIIAIWILLASAPIYWFSYGIPGNNQLGTWFNEIKGWAIFPAIYFAGITPGLLLLAQKDQVSQSLAEKGSYVAFGGLLFQDIIFYIFIVAVFIGAAAASRKIAFAGISGEVTGLKGLASKTGMSMDWALNKVYAGTLKNSVDGTVSAVSKRVAQTKDDISQSISNRLNLKSSQEIENTLGRKIGLRGADQKEGGDSGDVAKRIKTRREQLETDNESALNAILNPTDRKTEEDRQIAVLRTKLTSSDAYEALAAGELLFKKKKLGVAELKQMRDRYASFSPVAAKTFQDRMHKTIVDELSGREFKDGTSPITGLPRTAAEFAREEYREIMELLVEDGNGKAAGEFYKKIKNGKQQIAAIQAAVAAQKAGPGGIPVSAELLKDEKGNVINNAYDGYVLESENFSGKEWQEVEELHPGDAGKLGEALDNFLSEAKNVGELLRTTRGAGQNVRILNRTRNAAKLTDNYKKLERNLQRATDDLADATASGVAKDVAKATKTRDRAQEDIRDFEDRFRATIKRVSQQKKKQP